MGDLRELRVPMLAKPRRRLRATFRPALAVGPHAVDPQDDALVRIIDVDIGRRDVRVSAGRAVDWVGLRPVKSGVLYFKYTGLVNLPRTSQRIGVRQSYEAAAVMREV